MAVLNIPVTKDSTCSAHAGLPDHEAVGFLRINLRRPYRARILCNPERLGTRFAVLKRSLLKSWVSLFFPNAIGPHGRGLSTFEKKNPVRV